MPILYLHGEVGMTGIVADDIAHALIDHGEERSERPQASVVHDVVEAVAVFETFVDEAVGGEVGGDDGGAVALQL